MISLKKDQILKTTLGDTLKSTVEKGSNIKDNIGDTLKSTVEKGSNIKDNIGDTLKSTVEKGSNIKDNIGDTLKLTVEKGSSIKDNIGDTLKSTVEKGSSIKDNIGDTLKSTVEKGANIIGGMDVDALYAYIEKAFKNVNAKEANTIIEATNHIVLPDKVLTSLDKRGILTIAGKLGVEPVEVLARLAFSVLPFVAYCTRSLICLVLTPLSCLLVLSLVF